MKKRLNRAVVCTLFALCMMSSTLNTAWRAARTETSAVMGHFLNIVAQSFELAASQHDKEAQLHALAGIVSSVSHIVQIASQSEEDARVVLDFLEKVKANRLCEIVEQRLKDR